MRYLRSALMALFAGGVSALSIENRQLTHVHPTLKDISHQFSA
jgi:hypothetical protein